MTRAHAISALVVCLTTTSAGAQELTRTLTVAPATVTRWDAAAHVTWLGERRPRESFERDRWVGVASGGGSVGYYWTKYLKTEFDVATSAEGETYSVEIIPVPGLPTPLFIEREHEIRFTTAAAGLTGQFFENAWFHPFVGAGLELVREREHIETVPTPVPPRGPTVSPPPQSDTQVRYVGRPYVATGFKVYLSERAFIRTDIRTSWSSHGLAALGWRSGFGVDF